MIVYNILKMYVFILNYIKATLINVLSPFIKYLFFIYLLVYIKIFYNIKLIIKKPHNEIHYIGNFIKRQYILECILRYNVS